MIFSILAAAASASSPDPVAVPAATVVFGKARFTVLTPSLIRMESGRLVNRTIHFDDRGTSVVINRALPVPPFTVAHPNATTITITTGKLKLAYVSPPQDLTASAPGGGGGACGCSDKTCTDGGTTSWEVHNNTDVVGSHRVGPNDGQINNVSLSECFCACVRDGDCEAIEYVSDFYPCHTTHAAQFSGVWSFAGDAMNAPASRERRSEDLTILSILLPPPPSP
jgi:hypothetical protein